MPATIALRANGGPRHGFGHVRRTLTLALAIRRRGDRPVLIVNGRGCPPGLADAGVDLVALDEDDAPTLRETIARVAALGAGALVVDSYDVTVAAIRQVPVPVAMILDAPPEACLPAAMLVSAAVQTAGDGWPLQAGTQLLLGSRYALLRDEFAGERRGPARADVSRVLVTTGGTDMGGWAARLVQIVCAVVPDAAVHVVVGPYFSASAVEALTALAAMDRVVLHRNPPSMHGLMLAADMAVTGGGQTLFELAATGTPAVAVGLAANQLDNLRSLAAAGTLEFAGSIEEPAVERRIEAAIAALAGDRARRDTMSVAGRTEVDGRGAARVAAALSQLARGTPLTRDLVADPL